MLVFLSGCICPDDKFEVKEPDTKMTYADVGINLDKEFQMDEI